MKAVAIGNGDMTFPKRSIRVAVARLPQTAALVERIQTGRLVMDANNQVRAVDANGAWIGVHGFWLKRIWTSHGCSAVRCLGGHQPEHAITPHMARAAMQGLQDAIGQATLERLRAEEALLHVGLYVAAAARHGASKTLVMRSVLDAFNLEVVKDVLSR